MSDNGHDSRTPAWPAGGRSRLRLFPAPLLLSAAVGILAAMAGTPDARAAQWLCPGCTDEIVERAQDAPSLECPNCGIEYTSFELSPTLAFINAATRDTETAWVVHVHDCDRFHTDGLQAFLPQGTVWVPWSMVDWFIPRMRILRLRDGREVATDYPLDRAYCARPPKFLYELTDTLDVPGRPFQILTEEREASIAELFIVAFSPEGRDSARVRFIREIEAGLHPRLPRTYPRVYRHTTVRIPPGIVEDGWTGEALFDIRLHERRGLIRMNLLTGTGDERLDDIARQALRQSSFGVAGELGVGVPSWQRVRVCFEGDSSRVEIEPGDQGFWR